MRLNLRVSVFDSSAESAGRLGLWKLPKLMIQGGFQRLIRLEALVLFNNLFRFVVHPFDTVIRNGPTSVEPIQPYLAREQDAVLDLPIGSD